MGDVRTVGSSAIVTVPKRRTGENLVRWLHEQGMDIELRVCKAREPIVPGGLRWETTHVHVRIGKSHCVRYVDDLIVRSRPDEIARAIEASVWQLMREEPVEGGLNCGCF